MLQNKKNLTLSQGGLDIGLKVGILAEIGYMLQECALVNILQRNRILVIFGHLIYSSFACNKRNT